jgi:opacity protein-like surface antigen
MTPSHRIILSAAVLACLLLPASGHAQLYPHRTVKFSLSGGSAFLQSDVNHNLLFGYQSGVFTHMQLDVYPDTVLGFGIYLGYGRMSNKLNGAEGGSYFGHYGIDAEVRLPNRTRFIPYALFRFGRMEYLPSYTSSTIASEGPTTSTYQLGMGGGVEYMAVHNITFKLEMLFTKTGSDLLDNMVAGNTNDGVTYISFGLGYFF